LGSFAPMAVSRAPQPAHAAIGAGLAHCNLFAIANYPVVAAACRPNAILSVVLDRALSSPSLHAIAGALTYAHRRGPQRLRCIMSPL